MNENKIQIPFFQARARVRKFVITVKSKLVLMVEKIIEERFSFWREILLFFLLGFVKNLLADEFISFLPPNISMRARTSPSTDVLTSHLPNLFLIGLRNTLSMIQYG
ncbi:MAG: hypothetical protein KAJ19_25340 [Gammaproteobacteria bacterium]|nr:hypothetical protein [Gammaproteobacteria bacterium]